MSRKSKAVKAKEAYKRLYQDLVNKKDLNRFKEKYLIYTKIYGEMDALLFWQTRSFIFHEVIVPEWMKSTNIKHRNNLYVLVKSTLGQGLADELQRISSKRTY